MRHLDEGDFHQQPLVLALLIVEVAVVRQLHGAEEELRLALLRLLLVAVPHLVARLDEFCRLSVLTDEQVAEVARQTRDEVLPLEPLRQNLVQRQHALRDFPFQEVVRQAEVVVVVKHVQVLDGLLIGDVAAAERRHLVEDAQRVSHTAVGLLSDDVQRRLLHLDAFLLRHMLQMTHDVVHRHALEVVDLASAHDGRQNLVLLRRRQDEDGMLRRLLQRLQERVERRLREHVNLVDDEHLVLADLRRNPHLLDEHADVLHRVVRSRVKLVDVVRASLVERLARLALAARLPVRLGIEAVDGLREDAGTGRLAHATRTAEQIRMRQPSALDGILQRHRQRTLSHHRVERHRAVLPCRNNVILHVVLIYLCKDRDFFCTFANKIRKTMIKEYQIRVLPKVAASEQAIKRFLLEEEGLATEHVTAVRVLKRSIDARQRTIYVNLKVRAYVDELPEDDEFVRTDYPNVEDKPQAVVVGAGPGGLFAALRLIELGIRPVVVERGKSVHERRKDIAQISRTQTVDPESNYSFGEGGAGAFSDGKLYTRSKKRGNVEKILNVFCQHGASTSILADAHPHLGTDKLPGIIEAMRETIIRCGGEVHFETKMDAILLKDDKVEGVRCGNETFMGPVILATGHSARDVYRYLYAQGIEIEAKDIAVGVRLEHPSELIDQIQYHRKEGRGEYLPAAEYSFVTQVDGRGVYSFCMCPGGTVVPAASGPNQLVVNGMSNSQRNSPWSNSGMVVELHVEDLQKDRSLMELPPVPDLSTVNSQLSTVNFPLAMMEFQEHLEYTAWMQGNRKQTAPAQRMAHFVNGKGSYDLPKSSYTPGLISTPMHFWMPDFISKRLQQGFRNFGKACHGFLTNEAVMIGVETRTSAPVRILRDRETLQHVRVQGLFPCGEGAGYAGGIVSAGVDGERCAEMLAEYMKR